MKLNEFKHYCDRYGANISRWPQAKQDEAYTMQDTNKEAASYAEQALKLDALLAADKRATRLASLPVKKRILQQTACDVKQASQMWFIWRYAGFACLLVMLATIVLLPLYEKNIQEMAMQPVKEQEAIALTEQEVEYLFGTLNPNEEGLL